MSDMPERVRLKWCHNPTDDTDLYVVPAGATGCCSLEYHRADAQLTLDRVMKCPEVVDLVEAARTVMGARDPSRYDKLHDALIPFTK